MIEFRQHAISDLVALDGRPGLVIINPPFAGWCAGLMTNDASLAAATGPFAPPARPVAHGGIRVFAFLTGRLP